MLFPGNSTISPPPDLFETFSSLPRNRSTPLFIVNNLNYTRFPFAALSPALIPKNHPTWCTERFFFSGSRDFDWDACLWQLWLDSFGDVRFLANHDWKHTGLIVPHTNSALVSAATFFSGLRLAELEQNKLNQRLSVKYRAETCVLAGKRLDALGIANDKREKAVSRAAWLKSACEKVKHALPT
jgi:hypothetical protein